LTDWWNAEPRRSQQRFSELAERWRQLRAEGQVLLCSQETLFDVEEQWPKNARDATELGNTYRSLGALGIAVLPPVMDLTREGDHEFLWLIRELTGGKALITGDTIEAKAESSLAWWDQNKEQWTIPWPDEEAAP